MSYIPEYCRYNTKIIFTKDSPQYLSPVTRGMKDLKPMGRKIKRFSFRSCLVTSFFVVDKNMFYKNRFKKEKLTEKKV